MDMMVHATSAVGIDVVEMTLDEAARGLADGRFTSEALTKAHLDRIAAYEPCYNAFTFMNPDALSEARAIDKRRSAGDPLGLFAGVPVVIKEAMDFAGLPSTAGWAGLSSAAGGIDLVPERDAPVVARLKEAGAIILGKTNIPAFSHDGARANTSWKGPTYNAVDRAIAPGASSSGTATAIAASFALVGLAEETGGSIQNPAAAQSLVSVKPTFALVPNTGVAPLAGSTRDVVGPHARTVRDAALLLDIIAGYTIEDPKTVAAIGHVPEEGYTSLLAEDALAGRRLGLYGTGWREAPLSEEAAALYAAAIAEIKTLGAVLVDDPFKETAFADLAMKNVEFDSRGMESIVYDFDNFLKRLGPSAAATSFRQLASMLMIDPFAEETLLGAHGQTPLIAQSLKAPETPPDMRAFAKLRESYLTIFNRVLDENALDALVFPQSSHPLPGVFDEATFPATTVSEINIAGLPGVTVPAGRYANGAPFSLIFVGRMWTEASLLAFAYAYEQATRHRIIPDLEHTAVIQSRT
ncbi:amidase [Rhizobium sp. CC-YZS058]|uniref:amidase n=1 Tax=Rhizobium sp. CC-YZS058 TaxID=3042153 RepID=UPI002B054ADC|nr:amidase [Rhizobium sp. CC-YZS058]MEA3536645.1 amidase [Rhizobium sp. CC-YZS058]